MLFGKLIPVRPDATIPDAKADYRTARKIGFFRVSDLAFYQPDGSYLPRCVILDAVSSPGSTHVSGCCAGSVPVSRVVITTETEKIQVLCDNEKIAQRLAEALKKA